MVKVWSRTRLMVCLNTEFGLLTLILECAHHISVIKADFAPLMVGMGVVGMGAIAVGDGVQ